MKDEIILAIESSCDETAVALLKNGEELLANSVNTQIEDHKRFGGVYPELASRLHLQNITPVLSYVLSLKGFDPRSITHVAVTGGPGLPGALQIGAMAAKTIADYLGVPLIDVHHLAGHIYANEFAEKFVYPLLAIVVSGGNTELVYLPKPFEFHILGRTQDDAIGEAFDKVARTLGLPYPGGVHLDKITQVPNLHAFPLPKAKVDGYDLSYSGLKSHIIRLIEKERKENGGVLSEDRIRAIAYSTEVSFVEQLLDKAEILKNDYPVKMIVVGGGVSANSYLRKRIKERFPNGPTILIPPLWCTTDNAAMIAKAAHHMIQMHLESPLSFVTRPNRDIENEGKKYRIQ